MQQNSFNKQTTPGCQSVIYKHNIILFLIVVSFISSFHTQPAYGSTEVLAEVPVEHVDFKCPDVWVSTEELSCNCTITSGSTMTANLDYKDSTPNDNFPVAGLFHSCLVRF